MKKLRPGASVYSLSFLVGVLLVQQLTTLPSLITFIAPLAVLALSWLVLLRRKHSVLYQYITLTICFILLINISIVYSIFNANKHLLSRLPEHLASTDLQIEGRIVSIPVDTGSQKSANKRHRKQKQTRFDFAVDRCVLLTQHQPENDNCKIKKVRLSWYYGSKVVLGERWRFIVRMKPPHGMMNPSGFDYEAWLFQRSIDATGYIRKAPQSSRDNSHESNHENKRGNQRLSSSPSFQSVIAGFRQQLNDNLNQLIANDSRVGESSFSLVKALAIGEKSSISNAQWRVLTATGTGHLMAISGLHIGLAAMFTYFVCRRLIPAVVLNHYPAQHISILAGLLMAFLYAVVAGLSIPTQRAIIMLTVVGVMLLLRHHHRPFDSLGFALIAVLLFNPLAVLSAGFWFSFSAVAVIFISMDKTLKGQHERTLLQRLLSLLKHWTRLQLLISIFLLPLSLYLFQQVSLVSPLVNLLVIPYISFLVVPLVLVGVMFSVITSGVSGFFFVLAEHMLSIVWWLLTLVSELPFAVWYQGGMTAFDALMLTSALVILFYSRKLMQRLVVLKQPYAFLPLVNESGLLFLIRLGACLPIVLVGSMHPSLSTISEGDYVVTILDVGQGSAAVIETKDHIAVFDAGAKFSEKLDVGSSVVIPFLRSTGKESLDTLIISHGDSDHIGGAQTLVNHYPATRLLGQGIEKIEAKNKQACVAGQSWQWNEVHFEMLSPWALPDMDGTGMVQRHKASPDKRTVYGRNERSCVLKISSAAGSILFTGDIEKWTERALLREYGEKLEAEALVVPHHGSKTSSGLRFLRAVKPDFAVISAGYKNRYRLPTKQVVERYKNLEIKLLNTANHGAVQLEFSQKVGLKMTLYRQKQRKYWHHQLGLI